MGHGHSHPFQPQVILAAPSIDIPITLSNHNMLIRLHVLHTQIYRRHECSQEIENRPPYDHIVRERGRLSQNILP